jgi:hypothetical protein
VQTVKAYGPKQIQFHALLNWAVGGSEWILRAAALYTLAKSFGYQMSRRVGFCGARETFLAPAGNRTKFFGRPGRRFINIPTYNIPAPKPLVSELKTDVTRQKY